VKKEDPGNSVRVFRGLVSVFQWRQQNLSGTSGEPVKEAIKPGSAYSHFLMGE
jgi:hypothetical protein